MQKNPKRVLRYLRTHRRVWGLTRLELAELFGLQSAGHISRLEHGKRTPSVGVAFACQVIFGIAASALFPDLHTRVEEKVMRNVYRLHLALSNTTNLSGLRKRELCAQILSRATGKRAKLQGA